MCMWSLQMCNVCSCVPFEGLWDLQGCFITAGWQNCPIFKGSFKCKCSFLSVWNPSECLHCSSCPHVQCTLHSSKRHACIAVPPAHCQWGVWSAQVCCPVSGSWLEVFSVHRLFLDWASWQDWSTSAATNRTISIKSVFITDTVIKNL